jgi:hypothetical protein
MNLNLNKSDVKLAYKGPFYIDILSDLGSYLRQMYVSSPLTCNRLYKLFFELTQNVAKYSAETSELNNYRFSGIGSFHIEDNGEFVTIKTSNLINNEDGPVLKKYCTEINHLTKDELRLYRSEKRKPQPKAKDTGAFIGIIQIGIITQNKIECVIETITEKHSIFTIGAKVKKE